MRSKEHWTWNQDLLLLVLNLPLTHGRPWADTSPHWNSVSMEELENRSVFPHANLTPMHTHPICINMSNLGSWGRNISGMLCFVSFATAAFTPRILLLHSFYFSQDSRMSKALVLNCTEMFMKQNYTIFNVLSSISPYSLP